MNSEISTASTYGSASVRLAPDMGCSAEHRDLLASQTSVLTQAPSLIADLSASFVAANIYDQMLARQRENLGIGQNVLRQLVAMNLHSVSNARAKADPRFDEIRHYQHVVRDRVEAFRNANSDLYHTSNPQLPHFTEAKLVYALFDRLSQTYPDAALGVGCFEAAQCCFSLLLEMDLGNDLELIHFLRAPERTLAGGREPDHAFVVIGRSAATDPQRHETWNQDAVICDAINCLVYPKADIEERFAELQIETRGSARTELLARAEGGQAPFSLR